MPYDYHQLKSGKFEVTKAEGGAKVGVTKKKGKGALKKYLAALHINAMKNKGY
jgi:hypothetical protein